MSRASLALIAAVLLGSACAKERPSGSSKAVQQGEPTSGETLVARGDSLSARREYAAARAVYDTSIRVAGAIGDSSSIARALTGIGLAAWHQGHLDESKSIGERALALKQRRGFRRDIPKSLNALGLLAQSRGDLGEALLRFQATRATADTLEDSAYVVKARANLGIVYDNLAEFDRAREEYAAAAAGAKARGDVLTETNALNNLGRLEARVGDPDRAIQWLSAARAQYEKLQDPLGVENSLGQLGFAYAQRGEHSRAIIYLDSARTIAAKYELREAEADDLELMAQIYGIAGNEQRALELLRRAKLLADSLKSPVKLGQIALDEALVHAALNDLHVAQTLSRAAADQQRAAGARMDELEALLYVAELSQRLHDSTAATSALAAARGVAAGIGGGVAHIKLMLGTANVAMLADRPQDVLALLDAKDADSGLLAATERVEAEALRARASFRLRRYAEAVDAGRRAVAGLEGIRAGFDAGALRTSYAARQIDTYSDLVITLLTLGRVDEAFRTADAARGRALLERLGAAREELRNSSAADLSTAQALLQRIDALVLRLRATDSARHGNERSADASNEEITRALHDAREDYERITERLSRVDTTAALLGASTLDPAKVRAVLGPREALVEFLVADDRVLIFVLRRETARWIAVPIARNELAERVRLARELIAARDTASGAPLRALHSTLIEPLERAGLLNGVSSLIVIPHAMLSYVPFAALRDTRSHYLVERYSILSLSSASALPILRHRTDPELTGPGTVFAPLPVELPSTSEEATEVARHIDRARLVIGGAATEGALRKALATSPVVHIASHGALNRENPMFSSVALATPTKAGASSEDNGRLETYEVLSSRVRSHLVFLSGCETALGEAWSNAFARGEDYATLAQAFLFAGAHNVVATLWRIDDRAAAVFAEKFYEQVNTAPLPDALAAAQRALLSDARYSAPYYWAGYSLTGSGRLGLPRVSGTGDAGY